MSFLHFCIFLASWLARRPLHSHGMRNPGLRVISKVYFLPKCLQMVFPTQWGTENSESLWAVNNDLKQTAESEHPKKNSRDTLPLALLAFYLGGKNALLRHCFSRTAPALDTYVLDPKLWILTWQRIKLFSNTAVVQNLFHLSMHKYLFWTSSVTLSIKNFKKTPKNNQITHICKLQQLNITGNLGSI